MPRVARIAPGGFIYHVLNRSVGGATLFRGRRDFAAFQQCLHAAQAKVPMRILAYCVMQNHWHLVLWPQRDGELSRFMLRLTITHVRRWLLNRHQVGSGHLYQGRYKSFAVQDNACLATVCRYVERNAVRVGAAESSLAWPWSSAGQSVLPAEERVELTGFPFPRRNDWARWVDRPQTAAEQAALQRCIREDRPFGSAPWLHSVQKQLGWRERQKVGRPPKRREGKPS